MAIATVSASYIGTGPTASGQILALGPGGLKELAYIGTATFTGDGASTTATLNYIDGTASLPFTPSAILAVRSGGAATASVSVVSCADAANGNKTATVTFSAAPNAATIQVLFLIFR